MADGHEWRDAPPADYAVVGDPVSHSLSPVMHQAAYSALGLNLRYVALRVPESEFEPAMRHLEDLRYTGANVTVPLKAAAYSWCVGGDPRMGAVNTVRFEDRQGVNTDAPGFLRTLSDLSVARCRALVLGAGGSARSVCVALCDAAFEVVLYSRTQSKAERLVKESGCAVSVLESPDAKGCGLVVNATSAGLQGLAPDVNWDSVEPGTLAYDLLYAKTPTPFLAEASGRGLRGVDGKRLLVAQGALSFEWWTGLTAPRDAMMRAIE